MVKMRLVELDPPERKRVISRALQHARGKVGRPTSIPDVEVVETYPSGQPKTYRVGSELVNRRTYVRMIRQLKDDGYEI